MATAAAVADAFMEVDEVATARVAANAAAAVYRVDVAAAAPEAAVAPALEPAAHVGARFGVGYVALAVDVEEENASMPFTGRVVVHRSTSA
jgi:hypothetical protein